MAKDYAKGQFKASPPKKRKGKKGASFRTAPHQKKSQKTVLLFAGFLLVGILLGIFIAILAYLDHHKATLALEKKNHETEKSLVSHKTAVKPKPANPPKPHFDFYTILPNKTVDENDTQQNTTAKPQDIEYILQVASVKNFQDADRLRAQLLLLGYEVFITKSNTGKITWHRVNLGPFDTLKAAEHKQDSLRKNHVNSILLKRSKNTA